TDPGQDLSAGRGSRGRLLRGIGPGPRKGGHPHRGLSASRVLGGAPGASAEDLSALDRFSWMSTFQVQEESASPTNAHAPHLTYSAEAEPTDRVTHEDQEHDDGPRIEDHGIFSQRGRVRGHK